METFSALLAICAGNSPVPGEFPTQRPVTRSFDVYFDLRLNKRLCKQSCGWWFETLLCPLWRHSNGEVIYLFTSTVEVWEGISNSITYFIMDVITVTVLLKQAHDDVIKWKHFQRYWPFVRRNHRWPVISPHKGQWRGALMFSLICDWINAWVNNREAGEMRRHRAHYDVIVMHWPVQTALPHRTRNSRY